jgi:hypothetical protein
LSNEITLLSVGGEEKASCRTMESFIELPDSTKRKHGRLSWAFAQALLNTPIEASWISIFSEMEHLMRTQGWDQPLLFRGQLTRRFSQVAGDPLAKVQ